MRRFKKNLDDAQYLDLYVLYDHRARIVRYHLEQFCFCTEPFAPAR